MHRGSYQKVHIWRFQIYFLLLKNMKLSEQFLLMTFFIFFAIVFLAHYLLILWQFF